MSGRLVLIVCLGLSSLIGLYSPLSSDTATAAPLAPSSVRSVAGQSQSPRASSTVPALLFVENVGQFDRSIRFQVQGPHGILNLTDTALELVMTGVNGEPGATDTTTIAFRGANTAPQLEPFGRQATRLSYLIGADPAGWQLDVPVWSGVRWRDLYPGSDLELNGNDGQLHWRWHGDGPRPVEPLLVHTRAGSGVSGSRLANPATAAGEPDHLLADLVLESAVAPSLPASTLFGGSFNENCYALTTDASGAIYLAGSTTSRNLPTTPGARDTTLEGVQDMLVAKFDATGTNLVYATYLGGSGNESVFGLAVDAAGNLYLAGTTESSNFPRGTGGAQSSFGGANDAVLLKLSPSGNQILAGTFLGGAGADEAAALALTESSVVVVGVTGSPTFPGAPPTGRRGPSDAFVTRLDLNLSTITSTALLGGALADAATAVAIEASGVITVIGTTTSSNFPVTPGAAQISASGAADAFVVRLAADGATRLASTYLGGRGNDLATAVTIDSRGSVFVAGTTTSTDFPTSGAALQRSLARGDSSAAFVTKLNASLSSLIYSTLLGGSKGADAAAALTIDASGQAHVVGRTNAIDFPVTADALQVTNQGVYDAFVATLNATGTALTHATYLGGEGDDYARAVRLSGSTLIVGGSAGSSGFPTTAGAFQRIQRGGSDAFVTQFGVTLAPAITPISLVDDGSTILGASATATTWYFAEGFTGTGFEERLIIFNPGPSAAAVSLTYFLANGSTIVKTTSVGPQQRQVVAVHESALGVGPGQEVASLVETTNGVGIVVERSVAFDTGQYAGRHNGLGAIAPNATWYFAEGYTGAGFDEYLTILNPNPGATPVTITYFVTGAPPTTKELTVAGRARATISVHDSTLGIGRGRAVSARVVSTNGSGIVVERPIYFGYTLSTSTGQRAASGGHTMLGANAPASRWSFGEGYTGDGFDTYLTLLNPNSAPATTTITYFLGNGQLPVVKSLLVPANERATVAVHETTQGVGRGQAVSMQVETEAATPIVVERPIYFHYTPSATTAGAINGGHTVQGATDLATTWYLPDGNTIVDNDEFLTILNPAVIAGSASVTYYPDDGSAAITRTVALPPASRTTIAVHSAFDPANNPGGLGRLTIGHATSITTTLPVVVERPQYGLYRTGGGLVTP